MASHPEPHTAQVRPAGAAGGEATESFALEVDDVPAPPPPALLAGEVLAGRFRIVAGLGQGGMGQVYEAFDEQLRRTVALKVIRPELVRRHGVVERFEAEVRLAHRVTHPNVCRIFDLFQHLPQGAPPLSFLTMERLRGDTLADRLRGSGALEPDVAAALLRQLAEALAAAHRAGVVHGDLKPSNVMLEEEEGQTRLVVTDLGLGIAA